jgi:hypothetical protein
MAVALLGLNLMVEACVVTRYSQGMEAVETGAIDSGPPQVCEAPVRTFGPVDGTRCRPVSNPCYFHINGSNGKFCVANPVDSMTFSTWLTAEKYNLRLAQLHDQLEAVEIVHLLGYLSLVSDFGLALFVSSWLVEIRSGRRKSDGSTGHGQTGN